MERFACPNDSRSLVVWCLLCPCFPIANRSGGEGPDKGSQKTSYEEKQSVSLVWDVGSLGPLVEPGLGARHNGKLHVAGPHGPGQAQPEEVTCDPLPVGSPLAGESKGVGCQKFWVAVEDRTWAAEAGSRDVECDADAPKHRFSVSIIF